MARPPHRRTVCLEILDHLDQVVDARLLANHFWILVVSVRVQHLVPHHNWLHSPKRLLRGSELCFHHLPAHFQLHIFHSELLHLYFQDMDFALLLGLFVLEFVAPSLESLYLRSQSLRFPEGIFVHGLFLTLQHPGFLFVADNHRLSHPFLVGNFDIFFLGLPDFVVQISDFLEQLFDLCGLSGQFVLIYLVQSGLGVVVFLGFLQLGLKGLVFHNHRLVPHFQGLSD